MLKTAFTLRATIAASVVAIAGIALDAFAGPPAPEPGGPAAKKPEYPPFDKVTEDLQKVISTADGAAPLYDLYRDKESGRLLAVLPSNYSRQLVMIACTISGGDPEAGVMGPTHYVKWRKIGKQLVLIEPRTSSCARRRPRGEGLDQAPLHGPRHRQPLPIVTMAPGGRPVIDLGTLSTAQAGKFFGSVRLRALRRIAERAESAAGRAHEGQGLPREHHLRVRGASRHDGRLVRLTYAIGKLEGSPGYKPRKADPASATSTTGTRTSPAPPTGGRHRSLHHPLEPREGRPEALA